ncbi:MAG: E3 binding domain-containing protein [Bacteroidota bacterium]
MATPKTYTAKLVGKLPFSSVDVVVDGQTTVLGRAERVISEAEKIAFEKLAAAKGSPIEKGNLNITEIKPAAGAKPTAAKKAKKVPKGPNATDGAVQLAEDEGVDLNEVEASSEDGRITKADVEAYLKSQNDGNNQNDE